MVGQVLKIVKHKLTVLVILVVLFSCGKDEGEDIQPLLSSFKILDPARVFYTEAALRGELNYHSQGDFDQCGFVWDTRHEPVIGSASANYFPLSPQDVGVDTLSYHVVGLKINTTYYSRTFVTSETDTTYGNEIAFTTLADSNSDFFDFPGHGRTGAISFVIGGKGYMGLGSYYTEHVEDGRTILNDIWELDLETRKWSRKSDVPFQGLHAAVSFVIGDKAYVGLGEDRISHTHRFYRYDPISDSWSYIVDYPGGELTYATAFSIGEKGYVGTGMDEHSKMLNSFYEYTPSSGWKKLADYPGIPVGFAAGFSMNGKGYVGLGLPNSSDFPHQLWEYDPAKDQWKQKKDCPSTEQMASPVSFVIGDKAYVGLGGFDSDHKTIWRYDPANDSWLSNGVFKGSGRIGAVVFNLPDRALIGTGEIENFYQTDFAQYIPQ